MQKWVQKGLFSLELTDGLVLVLNGVYVVLLIKAIELEVRKVEMM